nr:NAD(P)-dependent oxidoreductase [Secundilactobacillus oryzae]
MGIHHIALRITGYDIIDFKLAKEHHILVTNVPAYSPRSVAEEALTHAMMLIRNIKVTTKMMQWHDYSWKNLQAREVHNLTVGVIGVGKIGTTTARLFKALGATVLGHDIVERPEIADTLTYVSKEDLLAQSDIVSIHTNMDESTWHLISDQELKLMKPTAILLNCARGPIVDIKALENALQNGEIAGAGLDTFEGDEHIFGNDLRQNDTVSTDLIDRLMAMDNVTVTPHIGFYTDAAVDNMVKIALNDVAKLLNDEPKDVHLVTEG